MVKLLDVRNLSPTAFLCLTVPHVHSWQQRKDFLQDLTDKAISTRQVSQVLIHFLSRTISTKACPRKMLKPMWPSFIWAMLCILFTTTLADSQTDTASTGTGQDVGTLISAISAAGALGTQDTPATTADPQTDTAPTNTLSDSEAPTATGQDVEPLISAITAVGALGTTTNGAFLIGSSITAIHTTSNALVLGTATLTAGGPEYTTDTYTISLGPSGILDINSQTTSLSPLVPAAQTTNDAEFIVGSSITATRTSSNAVVIGTATLTAGGSKYTTDTYTLSLGPSGILDINSQTTSLPPLIPAVPTTTSDTAQSAVTSTMTSAPPDVSTQIIHPPGISINTWITTSKDGESTIVPGIWCNKCAPGGDGGIVVVWNFPKLKFTEFDWPSFPGLPKFHLPCIRVLGVAVTDCPSPQSDEESSSEDGSDDDNNNDDNDNNNNDDDDDDNDEDCTTSITVTDCRIGCSVSYTTSQSSVASSTVCYTTTCMQSTGCDLRPTTTSTISTPSVSDAPSCAPPTPTPYNIWASYSSRGLQIPLWVEGALLPPPADVPDAAPITSSSQASSVTSFISCSTQQPDPGSGINSGFCVCEGSTVEMKVTDSPPDSCAYTAVPKTTIDPTVSSRVETKSAVCQVCTYVGNLGAQCSSISDCTPATTVTAPPAGTDGPADTGASPTDTESSPPYPTSTDSTGGKSADSALCHETLDPNNFSDFTMDEAAKAYVSMFDRGNVLTPGQTFAYSEGAPNAAGYQILASVEWAADQSGCAPEADFEVSGLDCQNAFENILSTCVGSGGKGGDFVYKSPQGCVHFTLEAPKLP